MALLGAQLVITLIMVSIIQKLGSHFSIARWILCSTGLYRFLYPDDNELKTLAGVPKDKPKSKKGKHEQNGNAKAFHIPRNLEIELETALVSPLDVIHLRYYSEYQWLLDFSLYSLLVYILSEVFNGFFPLKDDVNLSMVWCFLVVGFAFKMLITLTLQYFRGNESMGERSTCIVAGCGFLLVAMMVLIIDEKNLETGLDTAYDSFYASASEFLKTQGISSNGPASKLILKLSVAVWCGIIGALFIFPGMRMARMHWDSLRYCKDRKLMSLLLNASFASPFVLVLLWIKPVSRDYLTERIFSGMEKPLLTSAAFESIRLWCVVLAVLLRLCLMPVYLQAYLNMAHHRLELQKKEAGRITNVDLQKKIAAVFYYLCVVTLQYLCPIIMCLYLILMYKTLGGYTWTGFLYDNPSPDMCPVNKSFIQTIESEAEETSIVESAQQFQMAFDNMKSIFTEEVLRGLFGFSAWWCCFTWFATTALGLVYQSYFRIA